MSRRSRTGEVDPIPTPDERSGLSARVDAGPGFDFDDIDAAIGDLTADVDGGPVNAVELPPSAEVSSASALAGLAQMEAGFSPTDEQLPVPEPIHGYPSGFAATGDQKDSAPVPPYAQPLASPAPPRPAPSAPPPYAPPPYAAPSAPPPYAAPSPGAIPSGPPPAGRPIQNIETAYVPNPLMQPRPPAASPAPVGDPYAETAGQPEVGAAPQGRLVVQGGDFNGTSWYLNRSETRLGRGEENDIVVLDIGVSRHHLALARHIEGFRLIDLQSGNGTYLNGRRVMESELYDGDRIDMGHTTLVFTTVGPARTRPPGTAEHAIGRRLPTSWLVVMALTTFFTVLGTMYLVRSLKSDGSPPAVLAIEEAAANEDWRTARKALEQARAEGIDEEALSGLASQVEMEAAALERVQKVRVMVAAAVPADDALRLPDTVTALLVAVPAASMYFPETRTLIQQARQVRINALLDDAETLMGKGKSVRARLQVRTALDEDPGNLRAKALRRKLDALENR